MNSINLIIFFIISIILFTIITNQCFETFVIEQNADILRKNISNNIFDRHTIYDAIPNDKIIKYKNAYYYEYDNKTYEKKLKETFEKQKCYVDKLSFEDWKDEKSIEINSIYQKVYDFLYENIHESVFLRLGDNEIQIVHDVLNRYKYSKDKNTIIFDIDLILYRENKDNAKHINLQISKQNDDYNVFFIKVLGIINEDKIHMYPVEHNDPLQHNFEIF